MQPCSIYERPAPVFCTVSAITKRKHFLDVASTDQETQSRFDLRQLKTATNYDASKHKLSASILPCVCVCVCVWVGVGVCVYVCV